MPKSIESVFSGSCEPGRELEDMISAGEITRQVANDEVRRRYAGRVYSVAQLAAIETSYIQHNDI